MSRENKFGIAPLDVETVKARRQRTPGPMGTAIRDTAESLQEATEEKVEQRRRNVEDAKQFREALRDGRVLVSLPIGEVATDDLPRDRLDLEGVADSDEMEELKASIRERGQREPIEVYKDAKEALQLKKGWRRLCALRQLLSDTGEERFSSVLARIESGEEDRLARFVDMAEENIIREDLTFAEMAQLAITASADTALEGLDADGMVGRLYASLHKVKRSYIRSFVHLLQSLDASLKWPKAVARNTGVEVARLLKASPETVSELSSALAACNSETDQASALEAYIAKRKRPPEKFVPASTERVELHLEDLKVTVQEGECRIRGDVGFNEVPREKLERAIRAFCAVLDE